MMRKLELRGVSIRVDKLTRSIEEVGTGQRHETVVLRLQTEDAGTIKKTQWLFDWRAELWEPGREVYKLCRTGEPKVVQGLLSLEDRKDHVYVHLVENAKRNRGRSKMFAGVAGNLFAFACKMAFEKGYKGDVAFTSKTRLVDHYETTLGAKRIFGNRMFLGGDVAQSLVITYFSIHDEGQERHH